jgi:N-acetylglutamate synthase-like GNAT family acetyltransferase
MVEHDDEILGTVGVVADTDEKAVIRWLLLHPSVRGHGIGRDLMERSLSFARERGYRAVFLWTVDILQAAASLYLSLGFQIVEEEERGSWGRWLMHQRYLKVLNLDPIENDG